MIDATAAPATEEIRPAPAQPDELPRPVGLRLPRGLAVGWCLFALAMAWFLFAGYVRVGAGHWLGQRLGVRVVWSRFYLSDHGASPVMVGLVGGAAVLALVGSLVVVWYALSLAGDPPDSPSPPESP